MAKAPIKTVKPVSECMELMCKTRTPQFPFEEYIAWMQFSTWLRFPDSLEIQLQASATATALVIKALEEKVLKPKVKSDLQALKTELLTYPIGDLLLLPSVHLTFTDFAIAFQHIDNSIDIASDILEFFLMCPLDRKPSVNKALHFISTGGFVDHAASLIEQKRAKPSETTLKESWSKHAAVTPFFLAAYDSSEAFDYSDGFVLPPDKMSSVISIKSLLRERDYGAEFLGFARGYQETLIQRLDKKSRERFDFVDFPDSIEPIDVEWDGFTQSQLAILDGYKAQNWSY